MKPKMTPHGVETAGETWIDIAPDEHPGAFLKTNRHATTAPMEYFVFRLGEIMDRPVTDQTKLKGAFDFDLKFTRQLPPGIQE